MADSSSSSGQPVKGILKNSRHKTTNPSFGDNPKIVATDPSGAAGGIKWNEMNILMTNHPVDKDYGHMKIEEPKTPYHEMIDDDEEELPGNTLSPDDLASRVKAVADEGNPPGNKWEMESEGETPEEIKHKKEFKEWRKNHYDEFQAVKRARELMAKDLAELEDEENQASCDPQDSSMHSLDDDSETMQ